MKTVIEKGFVRFYPNGRPGWAQEMGGLQKLRKRVDDATEETKRNAEIRLRIAKARLVVNLGTAAIAIAFLVAFASWILRQIW